MTTMELYRRYSLTTFSTVSEHDCRLDIPSSLFLFFIITFISVIIYGLLSEINWMDGWMD